MLEFPESIIKDDIELIKLEPTFENAIKAFEVIDKNREHLSYWLAWVKYINNPEDEFERLKKTYEKSKAAYFIRYKNEIIGAAGFHNLEKENKKGEVGYWLSKEFVGMGIITKSVKMLEDLFFDKMDMHRMEIHADTLNTGSWAIPKRLGYHLDGTLRQNSLSEQGTYRDLVVYSKLKSEWVLEQAKEK